MTTGEIELIIIKYHQLIYIYIQTNQFKFYT